MDRFRPLSVPGVHAPSVPAAIQDYIRRHDRCTHINEWGLPTPDAPPRPIRAQTPGSVHSEHDFDDEGVANMTGEARSTGEQ